MTEAVLELKDVCFRWPNQDRATIDLPELKIDQGERIFLQGPSGSGKSTLLSLVGGILVAESGSLRVLGEELKGLSRARRDAFRVTHLGFIFQLFNLLPYLSLEENVLLPLRFSKKTCSKSRPQPGGTARRSPKAANGIRAVRTAQGGTSGGGIECRPAAACGRRQGPHRPA